MPAATCLSPLAADTGPLRVQPDPKAPQLAPVTGRDFAGLRLPGTALTGDTRLGASRVWAWVEDDPVTPSPAAAPAIGVVQRLLLQGDVRVQLGGYDFTAAQACAWIQQLPDPPDPAAPRIEGESSPRTRQIAIYFDRVSDPGGEAGGGTGSPFVQAGDRLLLTAILRGEVVLKHDVLRRTRPDAGARAQAGESDLARTAAAFTVESEQRLARHLRRLLGADSGDDASAGGGQVESPDVAAAGPGADRYSPLNPIRPGLSRVYEPNSPLAISTAEAIRSVGAPPPADLPPVEKIEPIFAARGIISFAAGNERTLSVPPPAGQMPDWPDRQTIKLLPGAAGEESAVVFTDGVVMQYTDARRNRNLQISAVRAVVFLHEGAPREVLTMGADAVRGVYLEGDVVATDGRYTLRGPKVYYDVQRQQAVMLDAVFWTYDEVRGLPLYVRAKEIRQLAANQFQARNARLATTAFFDPVFSLGTSDVTITRRAEPGSRVARRPSAATGREVDEAGNVSIAGGVATGVLAPGAGEGELESNYVDARDITLRAGGVPFFYLPRFKGEVDKIPLRDLRFESSSNSGAAIKTAWDLFGSTGLKAPPGLDSNVLLDWYFDRGPGLGSKSAYRSPTGDADGTLFAYMLPIDFGRDSLSSGVKVGRDHEFRGIVLGDYSLRLNDRWTVQLEGSQISDENFVDAFFRPLAKEGREITSSAYLKRQSDATLLTFLAKGEFNDFTPNQYLLQSQGFNVDKLPEGAYYRLADDLLGQSAPGALVWSHEYRAGRMSLNFTEPTAAELGYDTPALAFAAFGFNDPNLSPGDALRARGYTESAVLRADTRQELTGNFQYGVFKISPFLTGRLTAYDDSFDEFSSKSAPHGDEQYRYWYSAGIRTSTQITRVNNAVDNQLLDLHRTRHIIEPSATLWYAGANLSQQDLPTYDDSVESIATGTVGNFNIAQTWQTQRGGPGRWRSVDVLKLNTGITGSTDDADFESPIKRFYDYRPEYSQLGNFANLDAAWQVTDVVGLTADTIYDLDINQPARTSAGGVFRHSPDFSTYAEVRYINVLDATYVNFGADYRLTRRYTIGFNTSFDTDENEFQSYNFRFRRRVPEADIGLSLAYSDVSDETSIGFIFEPVAAGAAAARSQRLRDIGR